MPARSEVTYWGCYASIFWGRQVLVGEVLAYPHCQSVKSDPWWQGSSLLLRSERIWLRWLTPEWSLGFFQTPYMLSGLRTCEGPLEASC